MAAWLARHLARLALGRPVAVLLAGVLVAGFGTWFASRLKLETNLAELLPETARSVVLLKQLNQRIGGTGNVAIALESLDGKPDALRAYVPELVEALRQGLGEDLLSIKYQRKEVTDYYDRYGAWYVPLDQLEDWADRLGQAIALTANPALVDLDGESGEEKLRALVDEVRAERKKVQPDNVADPKTGLLISEDGRTAAVFVRPAADALNLAGSRHMMERIAEIVASTHPEAHGVRLPPPGYTGSIPTALTEYASVQHDIFGTALLVCLMVGLVVVLYFRGFRELWLLSGALIIGSAVAMGFAYLWIGHVNGQTAFLGAIIVGTGINYGIILLDRYRLARRRGEGLAAGLERAIAESLSATWVASLATACSFGVLAAGEVESFHQFGWIGGLGILACWVASFTCVPAALVLDERRRGAVDGGHVERPRLLARLLPWRPLEVCFEWLGRVCEGWPKLVIAVCALVTVASGVFVWGARHDYIETDMRKLATKTTDTTGIHALDQRLRAMDDRSSTPQVIATGSIEEAGEVCRLLRERRKTDLKDVMRGCHALADLLPGEVAARAKVMARLTRDLDKLPEGAAKPDERAELTRLKDMLRAPAPTVAELPLTLKEYFVERDGSVGKLAYVDPHNEQIESNLYLFTDAIRHIVLPSGKVIESSGFTVVFADVLRATRRDAGKLTLWSALLVYLVLAVVTRRTGTFLRVGASLLVGVVWMLGVAVLLGHKLNFFNFVALPTTFGVGIDYGINIEERLQALGRNRLVEALREQAPAVMLATATSIFGYGSLLTADSRALSSFGALAVIGEATCVATAVVLVPALFALVRRSPKEATKPETQQAA